MGSFGLLLIPALGGYLFLIRFNGTRDRIARQSGYHVVFKAAVIGIVLFALARLLVVSMNDGVPVVGTLWKKAIDLQYSGTAALSVLLGWLAPFVANFGIDLLERMLQLDEERLSAEPRRGLSRLSRPVKKWLSRLAKRLSNLVKKEQLSPGRLAARRKSAGEAGDHIGLVVDEAFFRSNIAVTLTSGKAYVGVPLARTFIARGEGGDLVLVPFYSGYRDKDTHELTLTVNYAKVLQDKRKRGELNLPEFRIAMPMSEIVTARPFSRGSYDEFAKVRRESPPGEDVAVASSAAATRSASTGASS